MTHEPDGPWFYQQIELGYNYRMTDIQAALGISQMERLDMYVSRRHEIAKRYHRMLADMPVNTQLRDPDSYSAYHLYVIRLRLDKIKRKHREIFESMREQKIGVNLHYIPVHKHPYYQKMGFKLGEFLESERYYAEAISIPMYASLTDSEQHEVVEALKRCLY
jgi:dTDP-4-amino-4,6-dideoxygalactose transaminase